MVLGVRLKSPSTMTSFSPEMKKIIYPGIMSFPYGFRARAHIKPLFTETEKHAQCTQNSYIRVFHPQSSKKITISPSFFGLYPHIPCYCIYFLYVQGTSTLSAAVGTLMILIQISFKNLNLIILHIKYFSHCNRSRWFCGLTVGRMRNA